MPKSVDSLKTSTGNEKDKLESPLSTFIFFLDVRRSHLLFEEPFRESMSSSISIMSHETVRGRRDDQNLTVNSIDNKKFTDASVIISVEIDGSK